jgi:hypothetical protein
MKTPSPTSTKVKHVGLDVHAETIAVAIAVAIAEGDAAVSVYGNMPANSHIIRFLHQEYFADGSDHPGGGKAETPHVVTDSCRCSETRSQDSAFPQVDTGVRTIDLFRSAQ